MEPFPDANPKISGSTIVYATTVGSSAWSYFKGHLSYMKDAGASVYLVSSPGRHLDACGEREGVTVCPIPMQREISPTKDLKSLVAWFKLLRSLNPDVVNVGTPKASLIGLMASWLTRTPKRVYTVRGLRYETSSSGLRALLMMAERLCCFFATDVIAVGVGVAEKMRDDRITRRPVMVIGEGSSNGVDAPQIAKAANLLNRHEVRAKWGIPPDEPVIGFVGRIAPDKGSEMLAKSLTQLNDIYNGSFRLLIVGQIEDEEASQLLSSLPIECHATGWLDDPTPAYKAMDILCLPSKREGFPNVVLEAGAASVPVVTTDATGAKESVVDGTTGFVIPTGDASILAITLKRLLEDEGLRKRLGTAGRERAITEYNPERIWSALARIYSNSKSPDIRYF